MIEHVCAGLRLTSRSPICHSVPATIVEVSPLALPR